MRISIDPTLYKASNEKLVLGILIAKVKVVKHVAKLWEKIDTSLAACAAFTKEEVKLLPTVADLQNTYKNLGKNPNQFKGSNEALLLRGVKGDGLYQINSVVDVNNLLSLDTRRSVGSYDLAKLKGDLEFGVGLKGQHYPGTKKRPIDLENLPVLSDANGPFGSPTSDSDRALIDENTTDLMMIIFSFDGESQLEKQLQDAKILLEEYADATAITTYLVRTVPVHLTLPVLDEQNRTVAPATGL